MRGHPAVDSFVEVEFRIQHKAREQVGVVMDVIGD